MPIKMPQTLSGPRTAPFLSGKGVVFVVAVLVSIVLISLFVASVIIGPILWGTASNTAALMAGKVFTYLAVANLSVGLIIVALACCCVSSCTSCLSCAAQNDACRKFIPNALISIFVISLKQAGAI